MFYNFPIEQFRNFYSCIISVPSHELSDVDVNMVLRYFIHCISSPYLVGEQFFTWNFCTFSDLLSLSACMPFSIIPVLPSWIDQIYNMHCNLINLLSLKIHFLGEWLPISSASYCSDNFGFITVTIIFYFGGY